MKNSTRDISKERLIIAEPLSLCLTIHNHMKGENHKVESKNMFVLRNKLNKTNASSKVVQVRLEEGLDIGLVPFQCSPPIFFNIDFSKTWKRMSICSGSIERHPLQLVAAETGHRFKGITNQFYLTYSLQFRKSA